MNPCRIGYVHGVPESLRGDAAELYNAAFAAKIAVAIRDPAARIDVLSRSLLLPFAFAAIRGGRLVGLAGYHSPEGNLTGGMNYAQLVSTLGVVRGTWAALIFSLYERRPAPGELLLDGIAVHPSMRGRGIGTRLLSELADFASREGYRQIRLDVVDTNPAAQRLYERNGFSATKTERFGYLRWLLGFGASTTMIRRMERADENRRGGGSANRRDRRNA